MTDNIFLDVTCPKCGVLCGNGGHGDMFCCHSCGWKGKMKISPEDIKLIEEFVQRCKERDGTNDHD